MVHSDRRITFSLQAAKAGEVRLWGDWISRFNTTEALTKRGETWTVTVGPVAPGRYLYLFLVDGLAVPDHGNPAVAVGHEGLEGNLIDVGLAVMDTEVPHGVVHSHRYRSSSGRASRTFLVYTPPGYSGRGRRYPMLVLLHGSGSNEAGWTSVGTANLLADELIEQGRMRPAVIVMPDGHGDSPADNRAETDLLNDVLPAVERLYRVSLRPADRAIAGASMGGFQALAWGLRNPDIFGHIGVFSAGAHGAEGRQQVDDAVSKRRPEGLIWIGIGDKDPLLKDAQALDVVLTKHTIPHQYTVAPEAGHTWRFWRQCLEEFLPRLLAVH